MGVDVFVVDVLKLDVMALPHSGLYDHESCGDNAVLDCTLPHEKGI